MHMNKNITDRERRYILRLCAMMGEGDHFHCNGLSYQCQDGRIKVSYQDEGGEHTIYRRDAHYLDPYGHSARGSLVEGGMRHGL